MTVFLMLIVYVMLNGQPKMEHKVFSTQAACEAAVAERAITLQLDEQVLGMVVAGCGQVPGQEVRN